MIRNLLTAAMAALAMIVAFAPESMARPNHRDWELLGTRDVGFLADKDVIQVGRDDGDFSKIQLRVKGNEIEMLDMKVVYGNGQIDDVPVREHIKAGGQTRQIDLKGGDRVIKRIELVYKSKPSFKGQATVEVWGRD